jgi:hypothetical protein
MASGFCIFQLLASLFQTAFTGQSPSQTVFPFKEKRVAANFHPHDIDLSGCLVFKPVPYFCHSHTSLHFKRSGHISAQVSSLKHAFYSFLALSLPFLASFVPLAPVALVIPILKDRLIDNLSTS